MPVGAGRRSTGSLSHPRIKEITLSSVSRVLVVEDSMIIALDTEESLLQLGVPDVVVAGNVSAAMTLIASAPPHFALLDYNLGDETSEPIAAELSRLAIPFYFVTGYGDAVSSLSGSQALGVLQKPFSPADLSRLLAEAGEKISG
jgi:DNA-binding NtrC family response regulator